MPNPEALGPASLALGNTVNSFGVFLPKLTDVRRASRGDDSMRKDVRLGQIGAVSVAMGFGIILSSLSGSPVPVYVWFSMSAVIIRSDEHTSELQSLMRSPYAVLCLKKTK